MSSKLFRKKVLYKIPGILDLRRTLGTFRAPISQIIKNKKKMRKLKNIYYGKRCFIIGNGPSLTPDDLEKIKGEFSFAANRIYNIFSKTSWRPTFYCVQDENVLKEMEKNDVADISNMCEITFIRMHSYHFIKDRLNDFRNLMLVPISSVLDKKGKIQFSVKADKVIYDGNTVTYMSMQLAAHMGFKEIILLGVDHNFPYIWTDEGELKVNDLNLASHFYDGAENNIGEEAYKRRGTNPNITTSAYQSAEKESRKHDFRIYNATRGGKLEVFERVNFDSVISES